MRIVAADTGGALLTEDYEPVGLIATAAVLVEKPYRTATLSVVRYANPFDYDMSGRQAVKDEAFLAVELAREVKPEVIHLDSTIGGVEVRKLDEPTIEALTITDRGKEVWKDLAKELRPLARRLWEETGIDIVAIGKSSVPVRIAEIYSGIYTAKWAIDYAREHGKVIVGLPRYMRVELRPGRIRGESLDSREGGLFGEVEAETDGIGWELYPNPLVRRYMVLEAWRE
ncbi:DUF4152 family protein [Thermococcus celer]|uniref:Uncharacterized protein n=1 Tax=Thermococcus celer Vu 13 = JCM 8558 TaxID=1293037 RepID=A0A218P025_THECE|nr:DUF4152 family protein [Thermococcus celer]ASI98266.1 hypothetical protein A3L02_01120 [Thermococcus celer Vu 13 = JCM 8558]